MAVRALVLPARVLQSECAFRNAVVFHHWGVCHCRLLHVGQSGMKEQCCNPLKGGVWVFSQMHTWPQLPMCVNHSPTRGQSNNSVITV